MDEWMSQRKQGRQKCGGRLNMVQGRRRRGWNKLWRCGDLLRKKQMPCFTRIYSTEGGRERAQPSSPPSFSAHTSVKAEQWEPHDWHMTMQARGFPLRGNHVVHWTPDNMQRLPTSPQSHRAHPPVNSSLRPHRLSVLLSFFLFFLLLNRYLFVCLALGAWHSEKEKAGVFCLPVSRHSTSPLRRRCELAGFFLAGMSGRDNTTGLRSGTVGLLRDEMIQASVFPTRVTVHVAGFQRVGRNCGTSAYLTPCLWLPVKWWVLNLGNLTYTHI